MSSEVVSVLVHNTYNSSISIAVDVSIDGGLITPVLQDADKVDTYSLSRKWMEIRLALSSCNLKSTIQV